MTPLLQRTITVPLPSRRFRPEGDGHMSSTTIRVTRKFQTGRRSGRDPLRVEAN